MSTSNLATASISVANTLAVNDPLTHSQRHKASVLIEPPATVNKVRPEATVESNEDYAPSAPLPRDFASQAASTDTSKDQVCPASIMEPPVVWTSGCSHNPRVDSQTAFVSLDFSLPANMTPQPIVPGAFAPVLPFAPTKIESVAEEAATKENPQAEPESPTPKPSEDPIDTPTPKPVETSEPVPVASSLGYSSTFAGVPSRTTGTSPPTDSYIQPANHLSYSQAASGKAFSESNTIDRSAIRPYAGPSHSTVTSSVAAYAGASTAAVSYTSAN